MSAASDDNRAQKTSEKLPGDFWQGKTDKYAAVTEKMTAMEP